MFQISLVDQGGWKNVFQHCPDSLVRSALDIGRTGMIRTPTEFTWPKKAHFTRNDEAERAATTIIHKRSGKVSLRPSCCSQSTYELLGLFGDRTSLLFPVRRRFSIFATVVAGIAKK